MNLLRTTFLHTKLLNTPFREENISRNELSLSLSLSLFSFQFFRSSTMAIFTRAYIPLDYRHDPPSIGGIVGEQR